MLLLLKVLRDKEMTELHEQFHLRLYSQQRIWDKKHMLALKENGASEVHRLSFKPIRRHENWAYLHQVKK